MGEYLLRQKCGERLIEADRAGLIPDSLPQLRQLIRWHTEPNPPSEGRAQYVRGPANLMNDIVGGHLIRGTWTPKGFEAQVDAAGRPKLSGGLMARLDPHHLDSPRCDQHAGTCEFLADVIEHTPIPPSRPPEHQRSEGAMSPAAPQSDAVQYARFLELHALAASAENHEVQLDTLNEYQCLLARFGVYVVDGVTIGPPDPTRVPNSEPIYNTDCYPIAGTVPRVCPRSAPRLPVELLPEVEARFRSLQIVRPDQTVLWVGRQARMESLCMYGKGCTCFAECALPRPAGAGEVEGVNAVADRYADIRQFARSNLKGQERAVVEALCDARGELPIPDLAVKDGVGWGDPFQGFKDVKRRLAPKLKRRGLRLERHDNSARLVTG
jgi:hypothetical protein